MLILILLHLLLVFGGTFFVTPELSVYPYLVGRGLIPYQNLIDQHFPLIFYGPINLSALGLTPQGTLILFGVIIILGDFLAYLLLRGKPLVFLTFILLQVLLGGNTFWIESFILLFLVTYFYFTQLKSGWSVVIAGLCLSLSLGLRPTLLPFAILLVLFNSRARIKTLLLLPIVPIIQIIWLFGNGLWGSFAELMLFNTSVYTRLSFVAPGRNEWMIIALCVAPLLLLAHFTKKLSTTAILLAGILILGYPRFDLTDLLPLSTLVFFIPQIIPTATRRFLFAWLFIAAIFITVRRFDPGPVNFFYPKALYDQASYLKTYDLKSKIYLFGGPDQLYQLTQSTPIGDYYLPSLPWYLAQPTYTGRQISALADHPEGLVVVNTQSSLGGVSLLDYGQPIWEYIQANYSKIDSLNGLDIYEFKN